LPARDEADLVAVLVEAVEHGHIAFARHTERGVDTLRDQGLDERVAGGPLGSGFGHGIDSLHGGRRLYGPGWPSIAPIPGLKLSPLQHGMAQDRPDRIDHGDMKEQQGQQTLDGVREALRQSEEALLRFRAAVDATADGIHIVDADTMRFMDVNETACRYLGYTRDEFLGLKIADIAPQVNMERLRALYARLFSGEDSEQSAEIVHRHRDGHTIPIEIRRRGTVINGRRLVVNVVRDITANKTAEQTIRHHALQQGLIAAFGQQAMAGNEVDELIARAIVITGEGLGV